MLARYPGRCDECERAIHVGDAIAPTEDGGWTCGQRWQLTPHACAGAVEVAA